jgi:hypothetical protein
LHWIRILRIFGFATIYFFIFAFSAVYFAIKSLSASSELAGYIQNPLIALSTMLDYVFFELPRSPLMMLTLFTLILQSLALGFVTDWVIRLLMRRLQLRKKKQETGFNSPTA